MNKLLLSSVNMNSSSSQSSPALCDVTLKVENWPFWLILGRFGCIPPRFSIVSYRIVGYCGDDPDSSVMVMVVVGSCFFFNLGNLIRHTSKVMADCAF